jgi:hypothetical protein
VKQPPLSAVTGNLLPDATNANQLDAVELQLVDVRKRELTPELVPESRVQAVEDERQQIPVSGDNQMLTGMPEEELANYSKRAGLSHAI